MLGNYKLKYNFESNSQLKIHAPKSKGRFFIVNFNFEKRMAKSVV